MKLKEVLEDRKENRERKEQSNITCN